LTECRVVGPAQPGPDPRDQLFRLERLDDVVIRAGLESQNHIYSVALGREHDDRHTRFGADLPADVDPVDTWQHQVEQDKIGMSVPEHLHRLVPVRDEGWLESLATEHDAEHLGQGSVVIDDEHTTFHGPHSSTETSIGALFR
jgi:hypothetical protein